MIKNKFVITLVLILTVLFFSSYTQASSQITYKGGDGSTMEKAVIIEGATGESDGVHSEYEWIRANKPGYTPGMQSLLSGKNNKTYDSIEITSPTGDNQTIFFDITDYFGKGELKLPEDFDSSDRNN